MKPFFIVIFLCFSFYGMTYPDSLEAIAHKEQALEFLIEQDLNRFYQHKTTALKLFKENDDLNNWIDVYRKTGKIWRDELNHPTNAIKDYTEALDKKWTPKSKKTWQTLVWLYANRAYTYGEKLNQYKKAREDYKAARLIMTETLKKNDYQLAIYIDNRLGNVCTRLGDYEQAIYFLKNSIQIFLSEERAIDAALASCDLGIAYYAYQQYEKSIETYKTALQFDGINAYAKGILFINLGFTYYQSEKYKQALQTTLLGKEQIEIAIKKKEHRFSHLYLATAYENLALIHQAQQKWELAEQYFSKNLELSLTSYGTPYDRTISKTYCALGYLFLDWNKTEQALDHFQKALESVLPKFKPTSLLNNPDSQFFYAENAIFEALEGKAIALNKWALEQPKQSKVSLQSALECYELSSIVKNQLRQTYDYETSKLIAQEKSQQRIEKAISTAIKLYQITHDFSYFQKAFEWAENSKNLLLLEQLYHHKATLLADIPNDLLEEENQIKQQLSYYQQELFSLKNTTESPDPKEVQELEHRIFNFKKKHHELLAQLEENYPSYQQIKYQSPKIDIKTIQDELLDQQALISYFYGDSTMYVFGISKNDYFVFEHKDVQKSTQLIQQFSDIIADKVRDLGGKSTDKSAIYLHQLYQILMQDVLSVLDASIDQLLIIPDKQLGYIPFEFLLKKSLDHSIFQPTDFLLSDYDISYAYSAALLAQQKSLKKAPAPHLFAGFAPKYEDDDFIAEDRPEKGLLSFLLRAGQYDLKGAKEEVGNITALLNGKSFIHEKATEQSFKQEAPNYRILHLAMHSLLENQDPMFSKLLFTKTPNDSLDDSYLNAIELYNMRLNAELAVLSACNTGYGKLSKGEGIMSLSRAFHYAGVPATVMSLWKVPDKQTSKIMVEFYKNLKAGQTKDAALRQAKLTYLEQVNAPELAHPFYWAGFIVVGDTAAMEMGGNLSWWWIGIATLLLIFLTFIKK